MIQRLVQAMERATVQWVVGGFLISMLGVGIPYWMIPYHRVNLPGTLVEPALVMVPLVALWLRAAGIASLQRAVTFIGSAVPAAVIVRILVETGKDPTSHNLWPFEIIIASLLGYGCALAGALVGHFVRVIWDRRIIRSRRCASS